MYSFMYIVPTLIVLQFSLRKVSLSNAYTNAVSAPDVCGPEVITLK